MPMRTVVRATVLALLTLVLATPASARQVIEYRGRTSAPKPNRASLFIHKFDSGRRKVVLIVLAGTPTCEEPTTTVYPFDYELDLGGHNGKIDESGQFAVESIRFDSYFRFDGTVGWGRASGTAEVSFPAMTADGQDSQLCTTGDLTWTAKRVIHTGGISTGPRASLRPGTLRIRVEGDSETVTLGRP
jgi:hypothetical protein